MGFVAPMTRAEKPLRLERLPNGAFTLDRSGGMVGSTLPSTFPNGAVMEIGRVVMEAFARAQAANLPLSDLYIHYTGIAITARELRGGALIFLNPATLNFARNPTPPSMHYKSLEEFVLHLENYIECWKHFNHYVNLARERKFNREDENQFLEIKSIIAQGLEAIVASSEKNGPKKEEVNSLFSNAPSLRFLSEMPDAIQTVESQWHKIFLSLQSLLGQLKVQQNKAEKGSSWSLFAKR